MADDAMDPFLSPWDKSSSVGRIMISAYIGVVSKNVTGEIFHSLLWPVDRKEIVVSKACFQMHIYYQYRQNFG